MIVAVVCARLLFYKETVVLGLALLGLAVFAFLVWKAFIKNGREDLRRSERKSKALEEEIDQLKKQVSGLNRELEEKSRSKLNVVELSPILHLAVMNIDSSFVRTFVRESEDGISFNGALRADICAEYGIKLEDMRFKYDSASNTLMLANFHPGLLSFSKKQLTWEIAKSFRTRHLLGHEFSAVSDSAADAFTKKQCEELRAGLEREIDERKISEFNWLSPMISQQVTDMFKMVVGKPDLAIVTSELPVLEASGQGYVDFASFRRQMELPESFKR
ncbi:MAG: hypothetical protein Q4G10_03045 [Bacteroidia bacterium]|nr:hypothetical protein [Bacteroidia bacterium]